MVKQDNKSVTVNYCNSYRPFTSLNKFAKLILYYFTTADLKRQILLIEINSHKINLNFEKLLLDSQII